MENFLVVGGGGRESAFALKLAEDAVVCAVVDHPNPAVISCVKRSGGDYLTASSQDPKTVLEFAQKNKIDYVFVSADAPLANGVVDMLLKNNIKTIGGTKAASRIEWDKIFSINLVQKTSPAAAPFFRIANAEKELDEIVREFAKKNIPIVVKPRGLTGGKGVKVMPQHLPSYESCREYAAQLLRAAPAEGVLLTEKLTGVEFTVMGFTDGENLVLAPATYDYPFRHENDSGPGTGGMGCFTAADKKLPFMDEEDLAECKKIMQKTVDALRAQNLHFTGILNGGFFKTPRGVRFMEFNARFGDPEALNILMVLDGSFSRLLKSLYHKTLREDGVRFIQKASVVKYLVSKEYPLRGAETPFAIDAAAVAAMDINIFCAACVQKNGGYVSLNKPSRVAALGCVADNIEDAAARINRAVDLHVSGALDFRRDIGMRANLELIKSRLA
ncbi:MAG: hypothetical protein HAW59_05375 [Betaproteobacteria bacterium]|nr:hypothetical protein [Betaproteobacteria bacterium]